MSRDPLEGVRPDDPSGQPDRPSVFVQPDLPTGVGQPDRSSGTDRTKVKLLLLFAVCAVLFGAGVALYLTPGTQPKASRVPKVPPVTPLVPPTPTATPSNDVVVTQGPSSPIEPPPPPPPPPRKK